MLFVTIIAAIEWMQRIQVNLYQKSYAIIAQWPTCIFKDNFLNNYRPQYCTLYREKIILNHKAIHRSRKVQKCIVSKVYFEKC